MRKKQEYIHREPMVKIPHDQMVDNFERLSHYDGEQFELVKSFYKEHHLHDQPSHKLMQLEARPILGEVGESFEADEIRRSYRFGVIVGSVIARQELERIEEYTSTLEVRNNIIDWPVLQLSRFALRNFFADGKATRGVVADKLEKPLRAQGADFVPAVADSTTANDWLIVGLGDALAFNRASYRHNKHQPPGVLILKGLHDEPGLDL